MNYPIATSEQLNKAFWEACPEAKKQKHRSDAVMMWIAWADEQARKNLIDPALYYTATFNWPTDYVPDP